MPGSPLDALHHALSAAVYRDLPDVTYEAFDYSDPETRKLPLEKRPKTIKKRRPYFMDVEVTLFLQGWESTAYGYNDIGGQEMVSAYTVIVTMDHHVCVYFGSNRLAYILDINKCSQKGKENFLKDLSEFNMAPVVNVNRYK